MTNRPRPRDRRGQALIEFALIALVLYLLLAAIIEFGRLTWVSQTVQSAADVAAREIARTPLSATSIFSDPTNPDNPDAVVRRGSDSLVGQTTYSEDFLAIDITDKPDGISLVEYLDVTTFAGRSVPIVNKMLTPAMIVSRVGDRSILRYPGGLVTSTTAPSGYTVKVPIVTTRGSNGVETIVWRNVVEEVQQAVGGGPPEGMFSVTSPGGGVVALRINYPFQAAAMSAFGAPTEPGRGNLNRPIVADDGGVVVADDAALNGGTVVAPNGPGAGMYGGAYGGQYGLGELGALNSPQLANGRPVRPFRRVVTGQAVARREVFE